MRRIIIAQSYSWHWMIGTRFVFGLTAAGYTVPTYSLVMEHLPANARIFQRSFFHWVYFISVSNDNESAGFLARASHALLLRLSVLAPWTVGGRFRCYCANAPFVGFHHSREHSVHTIHAAALIHSLHFCFCVAKSCDNIPISGSKVPDDNDACATRNDTFPFSTLSCTAGDRRRESLRPKNKVYYGVFA